MLLGVLKSSGRNAETKEIHKGVHVVDPKPDWFLSVVLVSQ